MRRYNGENEVRKNIIIEAIMNKPWSVYTNPILDSIFIDGGCLSHHGVLVEQDHPSHAQELDTMKAHESRSAGCGEKSQVLADRKRQEGTVW